MNKKYKFALLILLIAGVAVGAALFWQHNNIAVLRPEGMIADKERRLMIITTLLGLLVVIPVFILTFTIAWKYRASNTSAKHTPDWDHDTKLEFAWWAIPSVIILVLAIVTWRGTHELDPFKPLNSNTKPVTIQVIALQWKWLFIYPQQNIATVNYFQFPVDTPINFEITSDAPMNSFWIPQLGGQIYAMSGMSTRLHLIANQTGDYNGSSANISGKGFAGMKFIARSSTNSDFEQWVQSASQTLERLGIYEYNQLAKPSENNQQAYYALNSEEDLYNQVMMKYMSPENSMEGMQHMHEAQL